LHRQKAQAHAVGTAAAEAPSLWCDTRLAVDGRVFKRRAEGVARVMPRHVFADGTDNCARHVTPDVGHFLDPVPWTVWLKVLHLLGDMIDAQCI
jgi:hypothetical protein